MPFLNIIRWHREAEKAQQIIAAQQAMQDKQTFQRNQLRRAEADFKPKRYRQMSFNIFGKQIIIEAMAYAKPVFCSNLTSLPEVGGSFPYYWNNFDAKQMASVVVEGLKDFNRSSKHGLLSQKHAETFNWNRAAEEYLELYDRILHKQKIKS